MLIDLDLPSAEADLPDAIPVEVVPAPPAQPERVAPEPPASEPQEPETPEPRAAAPEPPAPPPETVPPAAFPEPKPEPPPQEAAVPPAPSPEPQHRDGFEGDWVLEPLALDYGHACGKARITGAIALDEELRPGVWRGTLRTTIDWSECPPEGTRYAIELRIGPGGAVTMTGSGGFVDRGTVDGDVMVLRDEYGKSVWRRR